MNKASTSMIIMVALLAFSACGVYGNGKKPAAPTGVKATASGAGLVIVEWDIVSGATSYNIYWKISPGVTTSDSKISNTMSPYVHGGLTKGTTYYYAVTSVNSWGESDLSAEASATP